MKKNKSIYFLLISCICFAFPARSAADEAGDIVLEAALNHVAAEIDQSSSTVMSPYQLLHPVLQDALREAVIGAMGNAVASQAVAQLIEQNNPNPSTALATRNSIDDLGIPTTIAKDLRSPRPIKKNLWRASALLNTLAVLAVINPGFYVTVMTDLWFAWANPAVYYLLAGTIPSGLLALSVSKARSSDGPFNESRFSKGLENLNATLQQKFGLGVTLQACLIAEIERIRGFLLGFRETTGKASNFVIEARVDQRLAVPVTTYNKKSPSLNKLALMYLDAHRLLNHMRVLLGENFHAEEMQFLQTHYPDDPQLIANWKTHTEAKPLAHIEVIYDNSSSNRDLRLRQIESKLWELKIQSIFSGLIQDAKTQNSRWGQDGWDIKLREIHLNSNVSTANQEPVTFRLLLIFEMNRTITQNGRTFWVQTRQFSVHHDFSTQYFYYITGDRLLLQKFHEGHLPDDQIDEKIRVAFLEQIKHILQQQSSNCSNLLKPAN